MSWLSFYCDTGEGQATEAENIMICLFLVKYFHMYLTYVPANKTNFPHGMILKLQKCEIQVVVLLMSQLR